MAINTRFSGTLLLFLTCLSLLANSSSAQSTLPETISDAESKNLAGPVPDEDRVTDQVQATSDSSSASHVIKRMATTKQQLFADQFWMYLLKNNYKHWSPAPGKPAGFFESEPLKRASSHSIDNPHTATLKLYMNRLAASDPKDPPNGSVIVMENYRSDRSLESISVMYRTAGYNPKAGDWYWVNYDPDGSVTRAKESGRSKGIDVEGQPITFASAYKSNQRLMGRASSCIACHRQTGQSDLIVFNQSTTRDQTTESARVASRK